MDSRDLPVTECKNQPQLRPSMERETSPRKMKENPFLIIVLSSRDQKSPNNIINNKK